MAKIRLTEQDLQNIVKEAYLRVVNEGKSFNKKNNDNGLYGSDGKHKKSRMSKQQPCKRQNNKNFMKDCCDDEC